MSDHCLDPSPVLVTYQYSFGPAITAFDQLARNGEFGFVLMKLVDPHSKRHDAIIVESLGAVSQVRIHGGTIALEASSAMKSTVTLWLPLVGD